MIPSRYDEARGRIYAAHDEDPTLHTTQDGSQIPYETHYSQKCEAYLQQRAPHASEILKLAICGQHFRRWEVPRDSYPMTKVGYKSWRTGLKKQQATLVGEIVRDCGYSEEDVSRCRALIEKEGLSQGEPEVQILEDVACLVFLDDQFDEFKDKHDEGKMVTILQRTWLKMSEEGRDMALRIPMTAECRALVEKALRK